MWSLSHSRIPASLSLLCLYSWTLSAVPHVTCSISGFLMPSAYPYFPCFMLWGCVFLSGFLAAFGVLLCGRKSWDTRLLPLSARRSQKQTNLVWVKHFCHSQGRNVCQEVIYSVLNDTCIYPVTVPWVEHLHQQALHTSLGRFSQEFWGNSQGFWEDSNRTLLFLNTSSCR